MFSSACVWLLFVSIHNLFMQPFCFWYKYFGEGLNVSESVIIRFYFFLNKFVSILIWVTVWFLDICLTYNWLHIPIICWITFWLTVRQLKIKRVRVRVFNTTSNNISVISWWSVLLVEETRVPGENHGYVASHWQTLSHNVVSSTPRHEQDSISQVISTDCTGSCKSNYHTITAP